MLVLKSRISQLIKKERVKERKLVSSHYEKEMIKQRKEMEKDHSEELRKNRKTFKQELFKREQEVRRLQKEIDRSYQIYQEIRIREKHLDELTTEVEQMMESMLINVQESTQPFLRARSKVEALRNRSARNNSKVESIFRKAR
jgi:hypothetical protein